jgi:ATP-binding cassette, subfamily B, bacterial
MNYNLNTISEEGERKKSLFSTLKTLVIYMVDERATLWRAFIAMMITAVLNLIGPYLMGYTIDKYIQNRQYHGLFIFSGVLLVSYIIALVAGYVQTKLMGTVGQRMLFNLRNGVFNKIQDLPLDFFNQNKAGDLISRINNDTDKINQFFSQSLMQFLRFILIMIGSGIFLISINPELGMAAIAPALLIWLFTKFISPWIKKRNAESLKRLGLLSSEVQESLNNFNVIVAFNRRDYFRHRFFNANSENYRAAVKAGLANNLLMPVYGLFSNVGQLIVLIFGIYLISTGEFTIGLLISFLAYINSFYNPLRQLAALWANFQTAMAGWDRILRILKLENDLPVIENSTPGDASIVASFRDVSFSYPNGKEVLHDITFDLERGKTYAFVGPTGGGKTTTASLIARLYDPGTGTVFLNGRDIRSYQPRERTQKIGFILQDPLLFSGTVRDNILYGNEEYSEYTNGKLTAALNEAGLESLLNRFDSGLDTRVQLNGDGVSLGQKQLIAFMRAVLRKPELLILDEATANIDTVTEQLLEEILLKLPETTTRVIIAHRLNTIENADVIYFVNAGQVQKAGSFDNAVNMLLHGQRNS